MAELYNVQDVYFVRNKFFKVYVLKNFIYNFADVS